MWHHHASLRLLLPLPPGPCTSPITFPPPQLIIHCLRTTHSPKYICPCNGHQAESAGTNTTQTVPRPDGTTTTTQTPTEITSGTESHNHAVEPLHNLDPTSNYARDSSRRSPHQSPMATPVGHTKFENAKPKRKSKLPVSWYISTAQPSHRAQKTHHQTYEGTTMRVDQNTTDQD